MKYRIRATYLDKNKKPFEVSCANLDALVDLFNRNLPDDLDRLSVQVNPVPKTRGFSILTLIDPNDEQFQLLQAEMNYCTLFGEKIILRDGLDNKILKDACDNSGIDGFRY